MLSRFITSTIKAATPGDFNARRVGDRLEVPQAIADIIESQGIRTSDEFLSYAEAFPSALAQCLGWSAKDAQQATQRLSQQLGSNVGQAPERPDVYFGARKPNDTGI